MKENVLVDKSKKFALNIVKICNEIKQTKKDNVLTNQLLRSGTSIGANIHEANYAHSKPDFIAKMQIALKECYESEYWIELLIDLEYILENNIYILEDCKEIRRILIKSCTTAKGV